MTVPINKIILTLINILLFLYLIILLVDHYYANYKFTSWASVFHILSCVWLGIRGTFWLLTVTTKDNWAAFTFYMLYWMPNPIEFGSFMLLPLFYAQILYPKDWQVYWSLFRPVYFILIFGLIIFQAIWSLLAAYEEVNTISICHS